MARLYLFAEGQTEQTFADTVLKPHLAQRGVFLHGPVLVANHRERGRVYRGGGRHYLPMKNDLVRFFKQEKATDVFFTTMIDLYAIYGDFPCRDEADRLRDYPSQRVQALEAAFAADLNESRFIPYIQLHEFEAYLFADAKSFELFYDGASHQIASLMETAAEHESPEHINDGPQTAPSKRIIDKFPEYEHTKPIVGPQVAELIGLDVIRSKCPHFNQWLTRLEELSTATT